ncbi:MAG TPA: hypothetical protein VGP72_30245 [Planctomycetota bacterium]|jgi:hypothetical protein
MRHRWPACVALPLLIAAVQAGEVLLTEDFENVDLTKLPPNCSVVTPGEVSIAPTDKGKSLRIVHKDAGEAALNIAVDIAKVRGKTVRASALIKCPVPFVPLADKGGFPQLGVLIRSPGGANQLMLCRPNPDVREWQQANVSAPIPMTAEGVTICLRVALVTAEAFFDDLKVEIDGPGGAVAGGQQPNAPSNPNAPPRPPMPESATQAPKKILETDGVLFSSDIAVATRTARHAGATANTYALVGPGAPVAAFDPKQCKGWTLVPAPKGVAGEKLTPDALLVSLPAFLARSNPEIVFLVADTAPRQLSRDERFNWEDLARLCLRMGAVPVLTIPPAFGPLDELRREIVFASEQVKCPMFDPNPAATLTPRIAQSLELVARHICDRKPGGSDGAKTKKEAQDE